MWVRCMRSESTHRQTWLSGSTSTYPSTDLLTARGVAHLVVHRTSGSSRPATTRFHPNDWRPLEACCRPWTLWCNDATALAAYATMMMMNAVERTRQITTDGRTQTVCGNMSALFRRRRGWNCLDHAETAARICCSPARSSVLPDSTFQPIVLESRAEAHYIQPVSSTSGVSSADDWQVPLGLVRRIRQRLSLSASRVTRSFGSACFHRGPRKPTDRFSRIYKHSSRCVWRYTGCAKKWGHGLEATIILSNLNRFLKISPEDSLSLLSLLVKATRKSVVVLCTLRAWPTHC